MAEERIEKMRKSRSQFLQNDKHILSRTLRFNMYVYASVENANGASFPLIDALRKMEVTYLAR